MLTANHLWWSLGLILSSLFLDAQSMAKDEEYEKGVVKGNMVYKIHWTEPPTLMPVESMCGHIPQVSIFDTKEVKRKIFIQLRLEPWTYSRAVKRDPTAAACYQSQQKAFVYDELHVVRAEVN